MPTRTSSTRRTSTSPSRFSRGPGAAQRPAPRGRAAKPKTKTKSKSKPMSGLLSSAASALPVGGGSKAKPGMRGRGKAAAAGGSKAKPAMALLAAAGAVLGRKQLRKRKQSSEPDVTTTPGPNGTV
jgi:hypothetical protein